MKIRLVAYEPYGARRGIVEPSSLSLTRVLGDQWSGSITWVTSGPTAERMALPVEVAFQVDHGQGWFEPPNCRVRISDASTDRVGKLPALSAQFAGLGVAFIEATVWDATPDHEEGKREFKSSTAGEVLLPLLEAAKARVSANGLTWANGAISWAFTATHDSAGKPWVREGHDNRATVEFLTSQTIFDVLDWLRRKGLIDWRMQGRELQVYRADDTMATKRSTTRIRNAFATSMPVKVDYSQLATDARFHGDEGVTFDRAIRDSVRYFGRIERHTQQGQTTTEATANLYLDELEHASKTPALQYRREWTDNIESAPRVFLDYDLGDWVRIDPYGDDRELRVVEQHISLDENGTITGFETLGTRILDLTERLARRTHDLTTGQVGSDSGAPRPPDKPDIVLPAPTGVVVSTDTIWVDGQPYGTATVGWSPVQDAARYEVWVTRPDWRAEQLAATVESIPAVLGHLPVGRDISVRVRAISAKGTPGAWSELVAATVPLDNVAPPIPTVPILSQEAGLAHVLWDGLFTQGQQPPSDFDHLEVAVLQGSRIPTDTDVATTIPLHLQFVWLPVEHGVEWTVRLRAVDWAGNKSAWSAPATITVTSPIQGALDESREYVDGQIAELNGRLDGKNKITVADTAPSGTGSVGDIWWRTDDGGSVIGQWVWTGSEWSARQITSEVIANLDAGKLTAGSAHISQAVIDKLWAEVITARKISAEQVEISRDGNLVLDPKTTLIVSAGGRLRLHGLANIQIERRGNYMASVQVKGDHQYEGGQSARLIAQWIPSSGSAQWVYGEPVNVGHGVETTLNLAWLANVPGTIFFELENRATPSPGTMQKVMVSSPLQVRPQVGGALIVNGGILADHMNVQKIWADSAWLGQAVAKIVTADMFVGKSFTGGTFTGPLIQTDASANRGIKLTSTEFAAYDAWGRKTVQIDATTGRSALTGRYDSGQIGEPGISIVPVHESSSHDAGIFWSMSTPDLPGGTTPGIWLANPSQNVNTPLRIRGQGTGGIYVFGATTFQPGDNARVRILNAPSTSQAANCLIDPGGTIYRSTSASRFKTQVEPLTLERARRVLDVEPVTFMDRGQVERHADALAACDRGVELTDEQQADAALVPRPIPGFIAEQVADAGLDELVTYDADGQVEGLQYERITAHLLAVIKQQDARIAALEERLGAA